MAIFATSTVDRIVTSSGRGFSHIDLDVVKDETEDSSASDSLEFIKRSNPFFRADPFKRSWMRTALLRSRSPQRLSLGEEIGDHN
jgi:hypothetical protein